MRNSDEQSAVRKASVHCRKLSSRLWQIIWSCSKKFQDNPSFKKRLSDLVFNLTYNKEGKPCEAAKPKEKIGIKSNNIYGDSKWAQEFEKPKKIKTWIGFLQKCRMAMTWNCLVRVKCAYFNF